eukprot:1624452-Rhodomonas_salina.1
MRPVILDSCTGPRTRVRVPSAAYPRTELPEQNSRDGRESYHESKLWDNTSYTNRLVHKFVAGRDIGMDCVLVLPQRFVRIPQSLYGDCVWGCMGYEAAGEYPGASLLSTSAPCTSPSQPGRTRFDECRVGHCKRVRPVPAKRIGPMQSRHTAEAEPCR